MCIIGILLKPWVLYIVYTEFHIRGGDLNVYIPFIKRQDSYEPVVDQPVRFASSSCYVLPSSCGLARLANHELTRISYGRVSLTLLMVSGAAQLPRICVGVAAWCGWATGLSGGLPVGPPATAVPATTRPDQGPRSGCSPVLSSDPCLYCNPRGPILYRVAYTPPIRPLSSLVRQNNATSRFIVTRNQHLNWRDVESDCGARLRFRKVLSFCGLCL